MNEEKIVLGFKFALIYVDDLAASQAFYEKYLGFEKSADYGPEEIFGKMGAVEAWMGGNYQRESGDDKSVRSSVMLEVASAGKLFDALKADGVKTIQDKPQFMGQLYWLSFYDPAGNIVEVLGGE